MNMISTGAFQTEMDASNKQPTLAEKFAAVWEKKNAKTARAGGVSLMALSLAACGSDSTTTTATTATTTTTTTTPVVETTPVVVVVTPINVELSTGVDDITGTSEADTVSGVQSGTAANDTSDSFDSIALGDGSDTLYIFNEQAAAYDPIDASGVDTFKYQANDNAADLDMDDAHGATAVHVYRATLDVNITDVTLAQSVTLESLRGAFTGSVEYKATAVTGAADSATVTLDDIQDGAEITFAGDVETMNLKLSGDDSRADKLIFDAQTTAITIDAGAALRVDDTMTAAGVTSLTITGSGAVRSDQAFAAATTIDASAATGAITLLAGATAATITTGSANDVIDMAGTLTNADTINLGTGDDTLRVDIESVAASAADNSISGVETLRMDAINSSGSIQMDNLAIANIRFDDATAANLDAGVITLTDLATTTTDFAFTGGGILNDDTFFSPVTIDYDTTTDVANITIAISNGGLQADDILVGAITADNVDQVTINATEVGQLAADEVTITDLVVDKATDVVVTSDGEVIFTGMDGNVLDTLDMSGADSGSTISIDDAAAAMVATMGDGADNVTLADTAVALTIDLGAGVDLFVSSTLGDTVTTGTGSDTVRLTGAATDDDNVITDFTAGAGGDILDFATSAAAQITNLTAFATTAGSSTLDNGMTVYTGNDLSAITEAAAATALTAATIIDANTASDLTYIAASDGTDTGIFLHTDAAGSTAIVTAELTLLVTLQGITSTASLTAANFADFI
jgi:hypothetical protein